jgi:hypothetical protein
MALMPKRAQQENGENYIMRIFMMSAAHQILCGLSNEDNEIGGTCGTFGEKDLGVYKRIILKRTEKK